MSETPPPYTGRSAKTPAKTPAKTAAVAPAAAAPVVRHFAIWHSRAVLIGVGALALLTAILTGIALSGFPSTAFVERLHASGVITDMVAVALTLGILTMVEYLRRQDPIRTQLPVNTRPSIFAIVALVLALLTVAVWASAGTQQLIDMAQGFRARYLGHTGGLYIAGIPWALSLIFGAWGLRPRASTVTNALAIAAIAIGGFLAVVAAMAALVYGAGLSD